MIFDVFSIITKFKKIDKKLLVLIYIDIGLRHYTSLPGVRV